MKNNILRLVEYDVSRSYGGSVRTRQIEEIIYRGGLTLVDHNIFSLGSVDRWRNYANGFKALLNHPDSGPLRLKNIWLLGSRSIGYREFFEQHNNAGVCLWETTFDPLGVIHAKKQGLPVIALPHNLECFVDWRTAEYPAGKTTSHLDRDLRAYAGCDAIFTISREEQWLLNLCGCHADYLPYYPERVREQWLLDIRRRRLESSKDIYLIIGAASYPPTYSGMVALATALAKMNLGRVNFIFAGHGTERLEQLGLEGNFKFLGGVSDETLRELMITTRGALIYQNANPGALTRIPELLLAGVPIIVNDAACRSWHDLDGLHTYVNFSEIETLLGRELPVPSVPPRPIEAEDRFLATVRRLLGRSNVDADSLLKSNFLISKKT